jgi:long-chain acyl-CoA synthetase
MNENTIAHWAQVDPEKPAIVMSSGGETLRYGALEAHINQGARLLKALGLVAGARLAMCIDNSPAFFRVACAAQRAGMTLIPVSTKLTGQEIAYIVQDSGAKAFVASPRLAQAIGVLSGWTPAPLFLSAGGYVEGYRDWDAEAALQPETTVAEEAAGTEILYSSGTTGRPKGIVYRGIPGRPGGVVNSIFAFMRSLGVDQNSVYLNPAPLYHSAPFAWSMGVLRLGGTAVVMESFDAEQALALIARHRVTISQWVPTHFVRMLKLPEDVRARYDVGSLKLAIHAAAPCPVPVKQAMIDWWGPIVWEYFGGSEQTAITMITPEEWLAHPGSVGRCVLGQLHICDDAGEPVPVGTIGTIHSQNGMDFYYHNDPEKTRQSRNRHGWTTVGDVGYLDDDGYLYLTDRKNFMIITGGVNVYPQEVENLLVTHPAVADAAVFGIPDADLGEKVMALIQPADMADATPAFAEELSRWLRQSLSGVKMPKRIEFRAELPRLPTGKMAKHLLRDEFAKQQ